MSQDLKKELRKLWNWINKCNDCKPSYEPKPKPKPLLLFNSRPEVMIVSERPSLRKDTIWCGLDRIPKFEKVLQPLLARKCYLTNVVKCPAPSGMNKINKHRLSKCYQWIKQELQIVRPKKIIALGYWAGFWLTLNHIEHYFLPHPSWILRFKRDSLWQYVRQLKREILDN